MLNTVEEANTYFATHFLGKSIWNSIDSATRPILLETAERDINAYLKTDNIEIDVVKTEPPFTPYQKAVFEWALYLYQNKDTILKNVNDRSLGLTTIQVQGIGRETKGSMSYKYGDTYTEMLKRSGAKRFLDMIYADIRIIR